MAATKNRAAIENTSPGAGSVVVALAALLLATTALFGAASAAPPIRTSAGNRVPQCVTPERLMAFVKTRNPGLDAKYRDIARWYKHYGESWHVRWDYAFYQMVLETNYLKYRRGDGRRGDVNEKQNNFAGIGATGGGVAGERFADVKTGVHAQIQHLVAYSGERVEEPVSRRTGENQDDIIRRSRRLDHDVTFADLAHRWAADRAYGRNIDVVADQFRQSYCNSRMTADAEPKDSMKSLRVADATGGVRRLGGPQQLAGPETLPWDDGLNISQNAPDAPPQAPVPDAPANKAAAPEPPAKPPQVRTIWSRQKAADPSAPSPSAAIMPDKHPAPARPVLPKKTILPAAQPETAAPKSKAVAKPAPAPAPAPVSLPQPSDTPVQPAPDAVALPVPPAPTEKAAPMAPPPDVADAEPPRLPTFKIAPAAPSHLGGPVPAPPVPVAAERRVPIELDAAPRPQLTVAETCRILTASYGGKKTLLVRAVSGSEVRLTALTVLDGFEATMFQSYANSAAPGAELVGSFPDRNAAIAEANRICAK